METLKCKVCGKKTNSIVNINFKKVPICDSCCNQITMQQVRYLCLYDEESNDVKDKQ